MSPSCVAPTGDQMPTSSSILGDVARRLESVMGSGRAQCFDEDVDSGNDDSSLTARRLQHKARRRHILSGDSGVPVARTGGVDDLTSSCSNAPANEFGLPEVRPRSLISSCFFVFENG